MSRYYPPLSVRIPTPPNGRTGSFFSRDNKTKIPWSWRTPNLVIKRSAILKIVELSISSHTEYEISVCLPHSVTKMLIASFMRLEVRRHFSGKTDEPKRRGIKILVLQVPQQPRQFRLQWSPQLTSSGHEHRASNKPHLGDGSDEKQIGAKGDFAKRRKLNK